MTLHVPLGERIAVKILGLARNFDAAACDRHADQLLEAQPSPYTELLAHAWRQLAQLKRAEADAAKKISNGSEPMPSAQQSANHARGRAA